MATQKEVAQHLDISERWVRKLVRDGVLPPGRGRGGYDLDDCRRAYIGYLRGLASGEITDRGESPRGTSDEEVSDSTELALLRREQRIGQELKNAQLRRELAPIDVLEFSLNKAGSQISAILEAIPQKVKRRVPSLQHAQIEIIKREVVKCQNMASRVTVNLDEYRDGGGDPEGDTPRAESA